MPYRVHDATRPSLKEICINVLNCNFPSAELNTGYKNAKFWHIINVCCTVSYVIDAPFK